MRQAVKTIDSRSSSARKHFENYLHGLWTIVDSERREPDAWEAVHVCAAIDAAEIGAYALASDFVDLAMAPVHERVPEWQGWRNETTLTQFKTAIDRLTQLPEAAPSAGKWRR